MRKAAQSERPKSDLQLGVDLLEVAVRVAGDDRSVTVSAPPRLFHALLDAVKKVRIRSREV
jgi:hypothetical protein